MRSAHPVFLYKYTTSHIYNNYIRNGKFRLNTIEFYRSSYEAGTPKGYNDPDDGVSNILLEDPDLSPSRYALGILTAYANAHILCFSSDYSVSSHREWHQRVGCKYDLCLQFDAPSLLKDLSLHISHIRGDVDNSLIGFVDYKDDFFHNFNHYSGFFIKPKLFCWENEYRFVAPCSQNEINHLDIELPSFSKYVISKIKVND
ncbi:hypothetical protein [Rheinheimera sp.]|uniref:hypothetical protein n=1 Tax=Rheinheimera sp. TaxID=1869214 RepID=UPI0027357A8B|nr:hypothetical protein [Rheinheimera sp.]MDP2713461.1 hypothetical protein [Rheinheimera sp.]